LAATITEAGAPSELAVLVKDPCEPVGPSLATDVPIAVAAAVPFVDATATEAWAIPVPTALAGTLAKAGADKTAAVTAEAAAAP
jgi:hypothetical protein